MDEDEISCKFCQGNTVNLGTKMCDNCWEVHSRVEWMPTPVLNRIVADAKGYRRKKPNE